MADKLAKEAANLNIETYTKLPYTDFYESFKKNSKLKTISQIKIDAETKGKLYFQNFYNDKETKWFAQKNLSRRFIVTINRCRSNHYNLAASLVKIGCKSISKCACQKAKENLNHVVWQCELYDTARIKLIKNLAKLKYYLPLTVDTLIYRPDIQACKYLLNFFEECQLDI